MLTKEEYWERYALGQIYMNVSKERVESGKKPFMAGMAILEEIAERELAFIQTHESLQQRNVELQIRNIELTKELNKALADVQRLLTIYEDPEE